MKRTVFPKEIQCDGKHRFDNRGMAAKVAKRRRRGDDTRLEAYSCAHCGGWHLGHTASHLPKSATLLRGGRPRA